MSRPRQYATARDRQAAYRQRMRETTLWVNRDAFARLVTAADALHAVLFRAVCRGDALAQAVYRPTEAETVEALVNWMNQRLAQPPDGGES